MSSPWPQRAPNAAERAAYADASRRSYWLDALPPRDPQPGWRGSEADLCIVGGGYTGLWAALYAKVAGPGARGGGARGDALRRGRERTQRRLPDASLTHGLGNGLARFPEEMHTLERLGQDNFDGLTADVERLVDRCRVRDARLPRGRDGAPRAGGPRGGGRARPRVRSRGGGAVRRGGPRGGPFAAVPGRRCGAAWAALVHPASSPTGCGARRSPPASSSTSTRPCWGSRPRARACVSADRGRRRCRARGRCWRRAPTRRCAGPRDRPLRRAGVRLRADDRAARRARWTRSAGAGRQGIGDGGNQFHYYRLDATGGSCWAATTRSTATAARWPTRSTTTTPRSRRLSQHFFTIFPQLEGVRFTHRWGGAIDTCSRFSVFFGSALGGRVVYALGYTGLGRRRQPLRRPGGARPARRARTPRRPRCVSCAGGRCRSRPSRCARR